MTPTLYYILGALGLCVFVPGAAFYLLRKRKRRKPRDLDLQWLYGGFNGAKAAEDSVRIADLKVSKAQLSFRWKTDMAAWKVPHANHKQALACLFVQRADGRWVGGKFDWISSSRSMREFKHVLQGYNGWTLRDVPNPCRIAFLVAHVDGVRRSNLLEGEWRR